MIAIQTRRVRIRMMVLPVNLGFVGMDDNATISMNAPTPSQMTAWVRLNVKTRWVATIVHVPMGSSLSKGAASSADYCRSHPVVGGGRRAFVSISRCCPRCPPQPLNVAWDNEAIFREDWLRADAFYAPLALDTTSCALPDIWDGERIEAGPQLSYPQPDHFDYAGR